MRKRLAALSGLVLVFLLTFLPIGWAQGTPTYWSFEMVPSVTDYYGKSHVTASLLRGDGSPATSAYGVTLQRSFDGSKWTTVTTMTSPTETYAVDVTIVERTCFRLVYRGNDIDAGSTSPTRIVTSRACLTKPSVGPRVYKGKALGAFGNLKPRHAAGQEWVKLEAQQYTRGAWRPMRTYGTSSADEHSYTKYSTSVVLPYTGRWRLRTVHQDNNHVLTRSDWAYTTVALP